MIMAMPRFEGAGAFVVRSVVVEFDAVLVEVLEAWETTIT
jgi:hypothetical protein